MNRGLLAVIDRRLEGLEGQAIGTACPDHADRLGRTHPGAWVDVDPERAKGWRLVSYLGREGNAVLVPPRTRV